MGLDGARFLGEATLSGARLYGLGPYPTMVFTSASDEIVVGEIYDVPLAIFEPILHMELAAGYLAKEVEVGVENASFGMPKSHRRIEWIPGGDWPRRPLPCLSSFGLRRGRRAGREVGLRGLLQSFTGSPQRFKVVTVAAKLGPVAGAGGSKLEPDYTFEDAPALIAILVIPGVPAPRPRWIQPRHAFSWTNDLRMRT